MLAFIGSLPQSAAAQAAFAISYTQLFSLITWTSVGLMGAAAAVAGQNLGAGRPDRADAAVHVAARFGFAGAALIGFFFLFFPRQLLAIFGMNDPAVVEIGVQLLRVLSVSGLFIAVALTYTGGLQGTGDTRSPLYISIVSQIVVPLGICFVIQQTGTLDPIDIWIAILVGHATRCVLSVLRFNQGKWRHIAVDLGRRRPTNVRQIHRMTIILHAHRFSGPARAVVSSAVGRAAARPHRFSRCAAGRPCDVPAECAKGAKKSCSPANFSTIAGSSTKDADGVWSVTVGPIAPEIYHYNFTIDGVRTIDPANPQLKTGSTPSTIASVLEVRHPSPAFYDAKPVPHGEIRTHWYQSKSLGTVRRLTVYTPPGYDKTSRRVIRSSICFTAQTPTKTRGIDWAART